jgi:hypothetical protein
VPVVLRRCWKVVRSSSESSLEAVSSAIGHARLSQRVEADDLAEAEVAQKRSDDTRARAEV